MGLLTFISKVEVSNGEEIFILIHSDPVIVNMKGLVVFFPLHTELKVIVPGHCAIETHIRLDFSATTRSTDPPPTYPPLSLYRCKHRIAEQKLQPSAESQFDSESYTAASWERKAD